MSGTRETEGEGRPRIQTGCANCPPKPETAPMNWDPDPGFGGVYLKRDGERLLTYMHVDGDPSRMTVQDFEDRAASEPDRDWRFEIHGPLGGVVYQRHGEAEWVAIEKLDGVA